MTSARETADVLLAAQAASGTRPSRRPSPSRRPGAGVGSSSAVRPPPVPPPAHPRADRVEEGPLERPEAEDVRTDLGFNTATPKARPPRKADAPSAYRLIGVNESPPFGFEAVVLRPDGKTTGYLAPTALGAREKAEKDIARLTGGAA